MVNAMRGDEDKSSKEFEIVLLKFGKREHLEQFRNEGLLYINSDRYFSELESDMVRGDRFEGTSRIYQSKDVKRITIEGSGKIITMEPLGPLLIGENPYHYNLYC